MALPKLEPFTYTSGQDLNTANASWIKARTNAACIALTTGTQLRNGASTVFSAMYQWSGDTFSNDQYAQAAYAVADSAGDTYQGPSVRLQGTSQTGYTIDSANADRYMEGSATAGFPTLFHDTGALSAGNVQRLEVSGSTLVYKVNGATLATVTDTTTTTGSAGFLLYGTTSSVGRLDNWEGGNVAAGTSYPITVSTTQPQRVFLVGNNLWHWNDGTTWNDGHTWAGTLNTLTPSVTQPQTVALLRRLSLHRALSVVQTQALTLARQVRLALSVNQTQTLALVKQARLTRALTQGQTLAMSAQRAFLRTVSAAQSQTLALVKQPRLIRAFTQSQIATVVPLKISGGPILITVSTTQPQSLALSKQIALIRSLTQTEAATVSTTYIPGGAATYPITRSVTQAQSVSLALSRIYLLTRSVTQTQTLSLRQAAARALALTQGQTLRLTQGVRRTLALTQSQVLAFVRSIRLTRTLAQPQTPALTFALGAHVYPIARSTSVSTAATLRFTVTLLPGPSGITILTPPPGSGGASNNYWDWPELIVTPGAPLPAGSGAATSNYADAPVLIIRPGESPPPVGSAIGGP